MEMYFADSPTSPGIILPHTLDEVDFLWHLRSRRARDIPQPDQEINDTKDHSLMLLLHGSNKGPSHDVAHCNLDSFNNIFTLEIWL